MQLSEACLVIDVLEPDVKLGFLEWFLDLQIQEYRTVFDPVRVCPCEHHSADAVSHILQQEEQAWLDKLDKRYAFIKVMPLPQF